MKRDFGRRVGIGEERKFGGGEDMLAHAGFVVFLVSQSENRVWMFVCEI